MVRLAARRVLVHWAREAYQVSECRDCRAVGVERSMVRYRSCRVPLVALVSEPGGLNAWRDDYNHHRPHSSLTDVPPAKFRAGGAFIPDRSRLQFARS